jgi:hypothetical protein
MQVSWHWNVRDSTLIEWPFPLVLTSFSPLESRSSHNHGHELVCVKHCSTNGKQKAKGLAVNDAACNTINEISNPVRMTVMLACSTLGPNRLKNTCGVLCPQFPTRLIAGKYELLWQHSWGSKTRESRVWLAERGEANRCSTTEGRHLRSRVGERRSTVNCPELDAVRSTQQADQIGFHQLYYVIVWDWLLPQWEVNGIPEHFIVSPN